MNLLLNTGLKLLKVYYRQKGKKKKIIKYLDANKIRGYKNILYIDKGKVKVAAVQVNGSLMRSTKEYSEYMLKMVRKSVELGAQLIAFPENNGLQLLGMIPGIRRMAPNNAKVEKASDKGINPGDIFKTIGPTIKEIYTTVFSKLSHDFGVYIMGGSIIRVDEEGELHNTAYLFGPDGKIIGKQDKLHLMPIEKEWGIKPGKEINVYSTEIGRIAFPVCMDATYFETFRILEKLGAEIVIIPIANPEEYNYWLALRGIWPRVQESIVYGVKSAFVGNILGEKFTGKSGVYCNIDISKGNNGIISESKYYDKEDVVLGELNLLELRNHTSEIYGDKNISLYKKYFPKLYEKGRN